MSERSPNPFPDNVFFDGAAVSWKGVSEAGYDARLGVIQEGFDEVFPIPESGERIWLHEPNGDQRLWVFVIEDDGKISSSYQMKGEGVVHVHGEVAGMQRSIQVVTPAGQGPITYMCDYPGVEPGSHE